MPTAKKKQSIFSKINLKSPKTRGIIILLAFAVIGGGVMVFRSFAATTQSFGYDPSQGTLKGGPGASIITEPGKNNLPVVTVANGGYATVDNPVHGITIGAGQNAQYCIYGTGGGSGNIRVDVSSTTGSKYSFNIKKTTTEYGDACSDRRVVSETLKGPLTIHNETGTSIRIRSFNLHFVTGSVVTPTYQAPNCTKNCNGK